MQDSPATTFSRDLQSGKKVEQYICSLLQKKYPQSYVIDGYYKGGDIVVPERNMLVEVKSDEMSHQTGNYLIEIEFDGEPSALTTTESEWWVILDRENMIWVQPDTLRLIIRDLGLRPVTLRGRGDNCDKRAYLVKREKLLYSPYTKVVRRS